MRIVDMDIKYYPLSGHEVLHKDYSSKYLYWTQGDCKDWRYCPFTGAYNPGGNYPTPNSPNFYSMTYEEYLQNQVQQTKEVIKLKSDYQTKLIDELIELKTQ